VPAERGHPSRNDKSTVRQRGGDVVRVCALHRRFVFARSCHGPGIMMRAPFTYRFFSRKAA
jgi:hypothetical protein